MFKFHRFMKPEKCSKLLTGIKNAHCTARPIIYCKPTLIRVREISARFVRALRREYFLGFYNNMGLDSAWSRK